MRKILFGTVIIIFLFNFMVILNPVSSQTAVDDSEILQTIDDLDSALTTAEQELRDKGFSASALKKLGSLKKRLVNAVTNASPSECDSVYSSAIKRIDSTLSNLEKRGCTQGERIMFRGKCAKFLNDPVKFQQCEAAEHGKKPKKPKMPKMLIAKTEMFRGKCAKFLNDPVKFQQCEAAEHGSKPSKPNTLKSSTCIPQDTLDLVLPDLQGAAEDFKSLGDVDDDGNGIPDFCDNNKKPMDRIHGGSKKPKKPKYSMRLDQ